MQDVSSSAPGGQGKLAAPGRVARVAPLLIAKVHGAARPPVRIRGVHGCWQRSKLPRSPKGQGAPEGRCA